MAISKELQALNDAYAGGKGTLSTDDYSKQFLALSDASAKARADKLKADKLATKKAVVDKASIVNAQPTTSQGGMTILRGLANSSGTEIGWDSTTKKVITATGQYTPEQMKAIGGQLINDNWVLPESKAREILGIKSNVIQPPSQTVTPTNQTTQPTQPGSNPLADMLQKWGQGYIDSQTAGLQVNRDAEIADIKASLDQAVKDGNMSVREAESQFEDQKAQIEARAYQDADRTALYGQEMGINNSQQMLGVQASDRSRSNSLVNSNIKDRDNKILNIKDRINALKNKASSDVDLANSRYSAGVLNAKGQANQMVGEKQFDFASKDYFMDKEQDFTTGERLGSQEFTSKENDINRGWQSDEASTERDWKSDEANEQREWSSEEALAERDWKSNESDVQRVFESAERRLTENHQITMQGNGFKHDASMTAQKFKNDLTAMAKSAGYQSALEDKRTANNMAQATAELNARYEMELKKSSTDLINAYKATNDPNSMQYKIREAEIKSETTNKLDDIYTNALGTELINVKLNQTPTMDRTAVDGIIRSMGGMDKLVNTGAYVNKAFDDASNAIESGMSKEAFIRSWGVDKYTSNPNITGIIDSMFANKEEAELIDQIITSIKEGLPK